MLTVEPQISITPLTCIINGTPTVLNISKTINIVRLFVDKDQLTQEVLSIANRMMTLEKMVSDIRDLLTNIQSFTFVASVNLIDNTEEDFVIQITGVLESKNYSLVDNNPIEGVEASLTEWSDGQIEILIKNNTGDILNTTLNFTINEIIQQLT